MNLDELLGSAPPRSMDSILSTLVRVRRHYDDDDETRQSNGYGANQVTDARLRLLTSLIDWIQPGVAAQDAAWDAQEAAEAVDRERSVIGRINPDGSHVGDWVSLEVKRRHR